jgi:glycosyltransferase involved in cell wall biosynthesis
MDEYQKRISLVLKAWKKLQEKPEAKDWTLKILGIGPDFEKYKSMAMRKGLINISFEGRQSPERYYREADIFLMTSIGIEGWGLTLTESLQRGVVPVVMNTCPVFSDIITHGYNGYLSPGSNVKIFTNYILSLMSDERRLRAMQSNALVSAKRFTLAQTIKHWIEII